MSEILDIFGTAPNPSAERIANVKEILTRSTATPAVTTDKPVTAGSIKYHFDLIQGTDDWAEARRGILTASAMKLIVSPSFKPSDNEKGRSHVYEIAAQRVNKYVEPTFSTYKMDRGHLDEVDARINYSANYAPVQQCGLVTRNFGNFLIGISPDGLVGEDGGIECKSRDQKFQMQTFVENVATKTIPAEFMIQVQTCLLVTNRKWWDFLSYSAGMPMAVVRVLPDARIQAAIIEASTAFEARVQSVLDKYDSILAADARLIPTERKAEPETTLEWGD